MISMRSPASSPELPRIVAHFPGCAAPPYSVMPIRSLRGIGISACELTTVMAGIILRITAIEADRIACACARGFVFSCLSA